jgi:hypothetical protein
VRVLTIEIEEDPNDATTHYVSGKAVVSGEATIVAEYIFDTSENASVGQALTNLRRAIETTLIDQLHNAE